MAFTKMLFLAFVVLFQLQIIFCEDTAPGIPIPNKGLRAENKCKATPQMQCNLECDSLMFCEKENDPPTATQKCAAGTPYCVPHDSGARCEATASDKCEVKSSFACTGKGYFPDLTDCSRYYLCKDVNDLLTTYKCPTGFYYSSKDEICKRAIPCVTVKCGTTTTMGAYSPDPRFWYVCPADKTPKTYRCAGDNDQFIVGVGCSFVCTAEGIFKRDDKSYYFCYRDGTGYKYVLETCPTGTKFDDKLKKCVFDADAGKK